MPAAYEMDAVAGLQNKAPLIHSPAEWKESPATYPADVIAGQMEG